MLQIKICRGCLSRRTSWTIRHVAPVGLAARDFNVALILL